MWQPKFTPFFIVFLLMFLFSSSCGNNTNEIIEQRDFGNQYSDDDQTLQTFLETHYYNYEEFESNPEDYSIEITIDTLAGDNANKTPLIDQVSVKPVETNNGSDELVDLNLYYLVTRQGTGIQPSSVDSTYVTYKGKLLDGLEFDSSDLPVWFNLPSLVNGFRNGVTELRSGRFTENTDGTFTFFDFGQGVVFMPSGLGYFSNSQGAIPPYSPLIFSISLYVTKMTDHDGDGVLSRDEDVDGDGNPLNDDSDEDGVLNLYDIDDDGDGVLTLDELDLDENNQPGDSDSDGIPNYLDPDSN